MSFIQDFYVIKLEENFLTSLFCRFTLAPISLIFNVRFYERALFFTVRPEAAGVVEANSTAGLDRDVPAAAAEHRSADPPPCREGVRSAVTRPPDAARLLYFLPKLPAG